jgi:hypothetical protein
MSSPHGENPCEAYVVSRMLEALSLFFSEAAMIFSKRSIPAKHPRQ